MFFFQVGPSALARAEMFLLGKHLKSQSRHVRVQYLADAFSPSAQRALSSKTFVAFVPIRANTLVSVTELRRTGIRRVDIATATTRHRVAGDDIGRQHRYESVSKTRRI